MKNLWECKQIKCMCQEIAKWRPSCCRENYNRKCDWKLISYDENNICDTKREGDKDCKILSDGQKCYNDCNICEDESCELYDDCF